MNHVEYQQPNQAQQPAYTTPTTPYNASNQPNIKTITADEESLQIIESIYPELRNSFVLLAIKNLKNDPIYQTFFKEKTLEEQEEPQVQTQNTGTMGPMTQNIQTAQNAQNAQTAQNTQTAQQSTINTEAFSSW